MVITTELFDIVVNDLDANKSGCCARSNRSGYSRGLSVHREMITENQNVCRYNSLSVPCFMTQNDRQSVVISAGVLHYDNHQSAVCSVAAIAGPATSDLTAGSGKDKYLTAYLHCRTRDRIPVRVRI